MKATTEWAVVGCWPGGKEVVCTLDKEVVCFSIDFVTRRLYIAWTRRLSCFSILQSFEVGFLSLNFECYLHVKKRFGARIKSCGDKC